ncbi:MAG: hypothetical protein JWM68_2663, partial [Verrucomicrobiales bacterium]|nr:hypothetical protein [Verrucomicrobiales bacterium]
HILGDVEKAGYAPKSTIEWLETLELPLQLLRFMQWRWVLDIEQIGGVTVWPVARTQADDLTPHFLRHKMLLLGCAPNGDPFVVDFSTVDCRPGFVSHETWSPLKGTASPPFEPIGRVFDSWLYRIAEKLFVPMDYYVAKSFNSFIRAEGKGA